MQKYKMLISELHDIPAKIEKILTNNDQYLKISNLYKDATGITQLQKPDKLYLENTNFQFVLAPHAANKGSVRETFAANQLGYQYSLEYTTAGDFLVDGTYTLEVGGRKKGSKKKQSKKRKAK